MSFGGDLVFEFILMILLGLLLTMLGISNIRGNISSIHWYNRKRVTKENQGAYGKWIGTGTVLIGGSLVITGVLELLNEKEYWFLILLIGIVIGLSLMIYAQFKYNKGIF